MVHDLAQHCISIPAQTAGRTTGLHAKLMAVCACSVAAGGHGLGSACLEAWYIVKIGRDKDTRLVGVWNDIITLATDVKAFCHYILPRVFIVEECITVFWYTPKYEHLELW